MIHWAIASYRITKNRHYAGKDGGDSGESDGEQGC